MGGTSTDVSLVEAGKPRIRRETKVGDIIVKAPSVDVRTIGAGGGSIAWVPNVTKALRVGPESAGAVPGPACYGKGGAQATVTDANAVLGYLPQQLLRGELSLDLAAAEIAVQKVADEMGVSLYAAAEGILKVCNEAMYDFSILPTAPGGRLLGLTKYAGSVHFDRCPWNKVSIRETSP